MSTFYIMESACDTVETGKVFPQIQKLSPKYDRQQSISIYNFLKNYHAISDIPAEVPNLDHFILHGHAKPTDLISNAVTANNGLFVSEKLKNILQEFDLPPHRFFHSKILHRGKLLQNYFWFFFTPIAITNIDFDSSTFFIYKNFLHNDGIIKIKSVEDYFDKKHMVKNENPGLNITIWASKLSFKREFKLNELFEISTFDSHIYISSKLRQRLLDSNITGCNFEETDTINTIYV